MKITATAIISFFALSIFSFAQPTWAGCDPCRCGNGGDQPPPTGCCYGPWKDHNCRNDAEMELQNILSDKTIQQQLSDNGGLSEIKEFVDKDGSYRLTARNGACFDFSVNH